MALVCIGYFVYFYVLFKNLSCVQTKSQKFLKLFVLNVQVSFYHGYKFGVNDLKATEGVTIFVIDLKSNLLKLHWWF